MILKFFLQLYHVKEPYNPDAEIIFAQSNGNDFQPFPKLEKAFTAVDIEVGFNIELKWTMKLQVLYN